MTGGAGYAQRHLEHSDYYDEHRRVRGEWQGRGAELLDLRGRQSRPDHAVRPGRFRPPAIERRSWQLGNRPSAALPPRYGYEAGMISGRQMEGVLRLAGREQAPFSVHEQRSIEVAPGDRLLLTGNRRDADFRATNGELVKVHGVKSGRIQLEDGRTLPANYREFDHGYAITAHRSQGRTVDGVILFADAMKQELFYVGASRGRNEIAIVTSDRELLRESLGISSARPSAMELAREQTRSHALEQRIENTPALQIGSPASRDEISISQDIGISL
jgi:hypothetical protein